MRWLYPSRAEAPQLPTADTPARYAWMSVFEVPPKPAAPSALLPRMDALDWEVYVPPTAINLYGWFAAIEVPPLSARTTQLDLEPMAPNSLLPPAAQTPNHWYSVFEVPPLPAPPSTSLTMSEMVMNPADFLGNRRTIAGTLIVDWVSGETIRLTVRQTAGTGNVLTVPNGSSITITLHELL